MNEKPKSYHQKLTTYNYFHDICTFNLNIDLE